MAKSNPIQMFNLLFLIQLTTINKHLSITMRLQSNTTLSVSNSTVFRYHTYTVYLYIVLSQLFCSYLSIALFYVVYQQTYQAGILGDVHQVWEFSLVYVNMFYLNVFFLYQLVPLPLQLVIFLLLLLQLFKQIIPSRLLLL